MGDVIFLFIVTVIIFIIISGVRNEIERSSYKVNGYVMINSNETGVFFDKKPPNFRKKAVEEPYGYCSDCKHFESSINFSALLNSEEDAYNEQLRANYAKQWKGYRAFVSCKGNCKKYGGEFYGSETGMYVCDGKE